MERWHEEQSASGKPPLWKMAEGLSDGSLVAQIKPHDLHHNANAVLHLQSLILLYVEP